MKINDPKPEPWLKRRERDVAWAGVLAGPGYFYRPGEVLFASADEQLLRRRLDEQDGRPESRCDGLDRLGLQLWTVDLSVDLPALVNELRFSGKEGDPPLRVAVNTALTGEGNYQGGPGGAPRSTQPLVQPGTTATSPLAALSVLDTGWSRDTAELHASLAAVLHAARDDVDLLDIDGRPGLDTEAGHGTFICGLVSRLAPGLVLDAQKVLDPVGWGDDADVALGLGQAEAPVLNLSLGGYTADDRPPIALEAALRRLGRDRVVVAAAGNNGSDRPFWPAAFKNVVAVAALDTTSGDPREATFSNRGPWVDVCAPGVHLQSFLCPRRAGRRPRTSGVLGLGLLERDVVRCPCGGSRHRS
jgi:hypothetical protein